MIDLSECSIKRSEAKKPHSFKIVSPTRDYVLHAETEASMRDWISALNRAVGSCQQEHHHSQDSMKLRVISSSPGAQNGLYLDGRNSAMMTRTSTSVRSFREGPKHGSEGWVAGRYRSNTESMRSLPRISSDSSSDEGDTRERRPSFGHQRLRAISAPAQNVHSRQQFSDHRRGSIEPDEEEEHVGGLRSPHCSDTETSFGNLPPIPFHQLRINGDKPLVSQENGNQET